MSTIDAVHLRQLLALYPALATLPTTLRDEVLSQQAQAFAAPAGAAMFDEGAPCRGFPLVLSGGVRVSKGSASGRRLELYRVLPGEMCVVSTSCLFAGVGQGLQASGDTVAATEGIVITPPGFERWCADEGFRRYVFGIFAARLADLMSLVEAVAFHRLDRRLAAQLLRHGEPVQRSHQQLADELGTAREMVTRLLKRFEASGWVTLGRERIEIGDADALQALADSSDSAP